MEILKKIKPSKEEEKKVQDLINQVLKKIKVKDAKTILGGSGAKGTWLRDTTDIDIYVKFNYKKFNKKSDQLSEILHKALKKAFPKVSRLHGSRDYFQVKLKNFTFEIVPILDIKKAEQAKNITDVSQLHVNYVKKYKRLVDDIRLAKAFAKAQECYGAESYIQGFSGYVLELLVIRYKSFKNLIRNAAKWQKKQIIGSKKDASALNISKKISPLILIDPVQKDRNAAAALSKEKFEKFKKTCKAYLKNPSEKFFEEKEFSLKKIKANLILKVSPVKGKKDIVGAKLLRTLNYIKKQLSLEGFKIKKYGWHWDKEVIFWYQVEKKTLLSYKIFVGPPISVKDHFQAFKAKHKKVFIKRKRSYAKVKRKYTKVEDFLKDLIKKDANIKARVKAIKFINKK